ncbi:MAG: T9SS type A sorting domain-containing protein, partial [Chitinophagales bacterium]
RTATNVNSNNMAELLIAPNPASSYIRINMQDNISRVNMYDFTGKLVYSEGPVQDNTMIIPLQNRAPGLYMVEVVTGSGTHSRRIIVTE